MTPPTKKEKAGEQGEMATGTRIPVNVSVIEPVEPARAGKYRLEEAERRFLELTLEQRQGREYGLKVSDVLALFGKAGSKEPANMSGFTYGLNCFLRDAKIDAFHFRASKKMPGVVLVSSGPTEVNGRSK